MGGKGKLKNFFVLWCEAASGIREELNNPHGEIGKGIFVTFSHGERAVNIKNQNFHTPSPQHPFAVFIKNIKKN